MWCSGTGSAGKGILLWSHQQKQKTDNLLITWKVISQRACWVAQSQTHSFNCPLLAMLSGLQSALFHSLAIAPLQPPSERRKTHLWGSSSFLLTSINTNIRWVGGSKSPLCLTRWYARPAIDLWPVQVVFLDHLDKTWMALCLFLSLVNVLTTGRPNITSLIQTSLRWLQFCWAEESWWMLAAVLTTAVLHALCWNCILFLWSPEPSASQIRAWRIAQGRCCKSGCYYHDFDFIWTFQHSWGDLFSDTYVCTHFVLDWL